MHITFQLGIQLLKYSLVHDFRYETHHVGFTYYST